jgi:hypothetical protein
MSNAKREDTFLNKEEKELKTEKMGEALPGLERVDSPWGYLLYTDLQSNRQPSSPTLSLKSVHGTITCESKKFFTRACVRVPVMQCMRRRRLSRT